MVSYNKRSKTHGHTRRGYQSPTYQSWAAMIKRCTNANRAEYKYYGGRGVKVCTQWSSFENFLADMGERPEGLTIDRINNEGHYEPGNCRWVSMQVQSLNRSSNVRLTHKNKTQTIKEWSAETGLSTQTICKRQKLGWSVEDTLTKKPQQILGVEW